MKKKSKIFSAVKDYAVLIIGLLSFLILVILNSFLNKGLKNFSDTLIWFVIYFAISLISLAVSSYVIAGRKNWKILSLLGIAVVNATFMVLTHLGWLGQWLNFLPGNLLYILENGILLLLIKYTLKLSWLKSVIIVGISFLISWFFIIFYLMSNTPF